METLAFDENYMHGLQSRDPRIVSHFVAFFKRPVWVQAKYHLRDSDLAEDAMQETLLRVLRYFWSGKTLDHSGKLPSFVRSTCRNVTLEILHDQKNHPLVSDPDADLAGPEPDLDWHLFVKQQMQVAMMALAELSPKDQELLRLVLVEEADRAEVCVRLHIKLEVLRVRLHRAMRRFQEAFRNAQKKSRAKGMAAG